MYGNVVFHSVGQGLFVSGSLGPGPNSFRWVYDCGTTSEREYLSRAIATLVANQSRHMPSRPALDLVFISHFDRDHINGITALLGSFRVNTLVLPYLPLSQRLALAFIEGIDSQQGLMAFFINPVGYIFRQRDVEIERIILVPPSDSDQRPDDEGGGTPGNPTGDSPWGLQIDTMSAEDENQTADLLAFRGSMPGLSGAIEFLRAGGRLRVGNAWEFVPYNDPQAGKKLTRAFQRKVEKKRNDLLAASTMARRGRALAAIRDTYDAQFGTSSRQRNELSLFVYAGSIIANPSRERYWTRTLRGDEDGFVRGEWYSHRDRDRSPGILLTGDGFLQTKQRLQLLTRFLGRRRVASISCLQVMHHGARRNWHLGVAAALDPDMSVFSSDPNHKGFGHPHAEVVRDFLQHGPVQADKRNSVSWEFGGHF